MIDDSEYNHQREVLTIFGNEAFQSLKSTSFLDSSSQCSVAHTTSSRYHQASTTIICGFPVVVILRCTTWSPVDTRHCIQGSLISSFDSTKLFACIFLHKQKSRIVTRESNIKGWPCWRSWSWPIHADIVIEVLLLVQLGLHETVKLQTFCREIMASSMHTIGSGHGHPFLKPWADSNLWMWNAFIADLQSLRSASALAICFLSSVRVEPPGIGRVSCAIHLIGRAGSLCGVSLLWGLQRYGMSTMDTPNHQTLLILQTQDFGEFNLPKFQTILQFLLAGKVFGIGLSCQEGPGRVRTHQFSVQIYCSTLTFQNWASKSKVLPPPKVIRKIVAFGIPQRFQDGEWSDWAVPEIVQYRTSRAAFEAPRYVSGSQGHPGSNF